MGLRVYSSEVKARALAGRLPARPRRMCLNCGPLPPDAFAKRRGVLPALCRVCVTRASSQMYDARHAAQRGGQP